MGLRDINIELSYRSDNEMDMVENFYIPVIRNAINYKRAVGYFSSTALIKISKGISKLIENGGYMQVVASPYLSNEDIDAIKYGYELKEIIIERSLLRCLEEPLFNIELDRYNYIAHLIANGQLDIRIAVMCDGWVNGMYHEKIGIVEDELGDKIAFTGSLNETESGIYRNFESIDVYKSWLGESDAKRVSRKEKDFQKLWNNETKRVKVYELPEALKQKILNYKKSSYRDEEVVVNEMRYSYRIRNRLEYPDWFKIRDYQKQAVINWERNNNKGLFNMATGTGKTLTALSALTALREKLSGGLFVIIVCPYTHLVEQWVSDVVEFNVDPIVAYSTSKKRDWLKVLKNKLHRLNEGIIQDVCVLTTNDTYKSQKFQAAISEYHGNVALVVDEAHNAGAELFLDYLDERFQYRLALSATPMRHFDEVGSDRLNKYFGGEVFCFGLEQAIKNGFLSSYYYYPELVFLNEREYEEYLSISSQIAPYLIKKGGKITVNKKAEILLIKRARLVAGAYNKLSRLKELMRSKVKSYYNLIYCGATYVENEVNEEEVKQINAVTQIIGNELDMRVAKFTFEESREERERIIKDFSQGDNLQAIVAIKCLDEGVNIPAIQSAYILASSTNPREFIQRRGRVLRKYENKKFAEIYDFITLPKDIELVPFSSEVELKYDSSLINKEISRAKEFASLAENKHAALDEIRIIERIYNKAYTESGESSGY